MAIAGKVAITQGGEWSVDIAYDKLVVVTFGNNVYLSIKPSTGIEPINEEYWMLLIENVTQEQYDNIINGTTTVGNALKLGGKDASEYALAEELAKRPLTFKSLTSATEANSYINDYSANFKDDTAYEFEVNITFSNYELTTGVWHINGTKINALYDIQTAKNYSGNATDRVITVNRAKVNGTWSSWVENATTADLANYLPLSGGTVGRPSPTPLVLQNTDSTPCYMIYRNSNAILGYIGFSAVENPVVLGSGGTKLGDILHTGNKPKGTYTGNGDATERTISVSGIGIGLLVIGNGCFTLISGTSAKIITDAGVESLYSGVALNLTTGTLKLSTTHVALNASGVGYTYQVL